jgi:hypothetical protein
MASNLNFTQLLVWCLAKLAGNLHHRIARVLPRMQGAEVGQAFQYVCNSFSPFIFDRVEAAKEAQI